MGLSPDMVSERMAVRGLPALSLPGARALTSGASDMMLFPKDPLPLVFLPVLPTPKQEGDKETRLDTQGNPGRGLGTKSTGPFCFILEGL